MSALCDGTNYRMGTHPSGPSHVAETDQPLVDFLRDKPSLVGVVPPGYPANDLPFLFKVLSVQTALSIQVNSFIGNVDYFVLIVRNAVAPR
jgi:hypothetical protein